jgi:hypothetical protein
MRAIPQVCDVSLTAGASAPAGAPADLLIEIPHGATRSLDFTSLEARLASPLPAGLIDFFHVNTDAGAPELAMAVAARVVALAPTRSVAIVRCRIPRTFIDCNRRIDAAPEDFKAGKVSPGHMPWITAAADRELLRGLYDQYVAAVRAQVAALPAHGAMLLLHTYAPRTVDVEVDADIVTNLHRAYTAEVQPTFPLRPEIDIIATDEAGVSHAPPAVLAELTAQLAPLGISPALSATYPMHPSTLAYEHVMARPGRALCVEVRRDLLAEPFAPFAQMRMGEAKVARLAEPLAHAVLRWW